MIAGMPGGTLSQGSKKIPVAMPMDDRQDEPYQRKLSSGNSFVPIGKINSLMAQK